MHLIFLNRLKFNIYWAAAAAQCQKRKFTDIRLNRRFSVKADVNEDKQTLQNFRDNNQLRKKLTILDS